MAQVAQTFGTGDFLAARTALVALTAINPGHADSWFNLGYACRQLGDFVGALDAYAQAIRQGLSGPEAAHVNRAAILSNHLGRMDEAESELNAALALNPDFLPAWLNLGELHEDLGRADAAREAYHHAQALDPRGGRAAARIAALDVLAGEAGRAILMLEQRCSAGLDRDDEALELLFALGNSLDAAGRHEEAFEAINAANHLSASLRRPGQRYVPKQMEELVDQLCSVSTMPPSGGNPDPCRALFICGMFRSGSTVFEQLIGRHSDIAVGGELETIPAFVHTRLMPYPDSLAMMSEGEADAMRAEYEGLLDAINPDSRLVTDKRPDNFLHIGLIKRLYPDAKFIVTQRGLLDNLISIYFLNFAGTVTYSDAVSNIVHYIEQYHRLMAHWAQQFPDDIMFIDYEALTADPQPQLDACARWLGLDPTALNDGADAAIIRTPSNWQARGPLHQRSVGRAERYPLGLAAYREEMDRLEKLTPVGG